MTASGFRDTPVPVAVRGVTLLAEARVVIEPSCMDLRVRVWLLTGGLDLVRSRRPDSIADPAVPSCDPLEQQAPPVVIAVPLERPSALSLPLLPPRRHLPGGDKLHPGRTRPARSAPR